jgi:hypothetical protein
VGGRYRRKEISWKWVSGELRGRGGGEASRKSRQTFCLKKKTTKREKRRRIERAEWSRRPINLKSTASEPYLISLIF